MFQIENTEAEAEKFIAQKPKDGNIYKFDLLHYHFLYIPIS